MEVSLNFNYQDWLACCGSPQFAAEMVKIGPFTNAEEALLASQEIWWNKVNIPGWLEAFAAHPRIGDLNLKSLPSSDWCKGEQLAALKSADDNILQELAELNRQYEARFGFVFLVCATGKSSAEILPILKGRLSNKPVEELQVAASEQQKITEIRIHKLIASKFSPHEGYSAASQYSTGSLTAGWRLNKIQAHVSGSERGNSCNDKDGVSASQETDASKKQLATLPTRPPITTHALDVSLGRPAAGLDITLEKWEPSDVGGGWKHVGSSTTDNDGRCGQLMAVSEIVAAGQYKLIFKTNEYFRRTKNGGSTDWFYPVISIMFDIKPHQEHEHFHVPILLSPYSFTTYRGS